MRYQHEVKSLVVQAFSIGASRRRLTYASPRESMTSHCNTVMIGCSVGLRQCSSSFMHFAIKPVREMSENVRLFGAVNGAGIVNGHSKFFSFLLILLPTCVAYNFMPFLHSLNEKHSLGAHGRQANGMLVSPIFLCIKWPHHCHHCNVITFHMHFCLCASGLLYKE